MNRRGFLLSTLLGLNACATAGKLAEPRDIRANPFTLGIASGDVTDRAVVLWSRLAPKPQAEDGGMALLDVPVRWELSLTPDMSRIVRRGEALARPQLAHSLHIDVDDLQPNHSYWYRFKVAGFESAIGKTKTLPGITDALEAVRFVTASCQNYTHGSFVAYEHMVRDNPDFILHLGDYIYDTSFGETYRQHETETRPVTVTDFRRRHALYKSDEHLQRAHAHIPFFTTIDNHDAAEDADQDTLQMRAAAYQAWYEHMPVRGYQLDAPNVFDLQRRIQLGDLAQICLPDVRQFRDSRSACSINAYPKYGFGNYRERCAAALDSQRTMLGEDQESQLHRRLTNNTAQWNVLASPGPFLPFSYQHDGKDLRYVGAWDAYPANRQRTATAIDAASNGHPLVLSGDVHSFWAMDGTKVAASGERFNLTEFVTSSVSANWPAPLSQPVIDNLPNNRHVSFYDGDKRGYLLHEIDHRQWRTTARAVIDAKSETSEATNLATFVVTHGEPGFKTTR